MYIMSIKTEHKKDDLKETTHDEVHDITIWPSF